MIVSLWVCQQCIIFITILQVYEIKLQHMEITCWRIYGSNFIENQFTLDIV